MPQDDQPFIGKVEVVNAQSEPDLAVTISGITPSPLPTTDAADGTPGTPPPAKAIQVAGTDGTDLRALLTDNTGKLYVLVDGDVTVNQGTSPWVVDGTVTADQGGSWTVAATQDGTWTVEVSGTVTVGGTVTADQGGAWTVAATQDGAWTVAATQSGAWTVTADQGGSWTVAVSGTVTVVGDAASGSPVAGNPVLVAGSDGTDARTLATDTSGRQLVQNYRSDGRAWPLGAKLAAGNVTTTGGGATFLAAPGAGNHILILGISIGVNAASGNFVQLEATIGGVTNVFITVLGGNSQGIVIPGGLLLDANTAITGIAGTSAGGAAAIYYDVVT